MAMSRLQANLRVNNYVYQMNALSCPSLCGEAYRVHFLGAPALKLLLKKARKQLKRLEAQEEVNLLDEETEAALDGEHF